MKLAVVVSRTVREPHRRKRIETRRLPVLFIDSGKLRFSKKEDTSEIYHRLLRRVHETVGNDWGIAAFCLARDQNRLTLRSV